MANRIKRIIMKRKFSNGDVETYYPQVRPKDVKVSSESTLEPYLAKLDKMTEDSTKVEKSNTNGNIKINSKEVNVYSHPKTVNDSGTVYNNVTIDNYGHVIDGSNSTDISDKTVNFTMSETRLNITKADSVKVLFSKINKWFGDIKALAFLDKVGVSQLDTTLTTEYGKRVTKDNVTESLVITEPGWVPDARVLPSIMDNLNTLNNKTLKSNVTIYVSTNGSDSTGNGTQINPYKTIWYATSSIPKNLGGYSATINIVDGTYSETLNINGFYSGIITLKGNSLNVILTSEWPHGIYNNNARVLIDTIKFIRSDSVGNPVLAYGNNTYTQLASCVIDSGTNIRSGVDISGTNIRFTSNIFYNCNICIFVTVSTTNAVASNITMDNCTGSNNVRLFSARRCTIHLQDNVRPGTSLDDIITEGALIVRPTGGVVGSLTSSIILYVATTGNDSTGDGTSTKPFKTIQRAIDTVPKDLGGYMATINIADGTYSERIIIKAFHSGLLTLKGNSVNVNVSSLSTHSIVDNQARVVINTIHFIRSDTIQNPVLETINSKYVQLTSCTIDANSREQSGINIQGSNIRFLSTVFNNCRDCIYVIQSSAEDTVPSTISMCGCTGSNNIRVFNLRKATVHMEDNIRPSASVPDLISEGGLIVKPYGAVIGTLQQDTILYVSTTGSDSIGDGSNAKPFKTIQYAIDSIPKDLGGYTATINIADGAYDGVKLRSYHSGVLNFRGSEKGIDNLSCVINGSFDIAYCNCVVSMKYINFKTTQSASVNASYVLSLQAQYVSSVTAAEHPGINMVGVPTFIVDQSKFSNRNIGVLAHDSQGWVAATSGTNNSIGILSEYGSTVKLIGNGVFPDGNITKFKSELGGVFFQPSGTQISSLITSGLSCSWGTISGGYIRHGGGVNSLAMITVCVQIITTSVLTSGIDYAISGFPRPITTNDIPVTNNIPINMNSYLKSSNGNIIHGSTTDRTVGTVIQFSLTYPTIY